MESQDKDKEYEDNIWEVYRREWVAAGTDKRIELTRRMLRWQALMKVGLPAQQAYYKAMEQESDFRVAEEPSDKSPGYSFQHWVRKTPLTVLRWALVAAIVYGVVVTVGRNALNTELESVQSELTSTQSDLGSTKQTLTSTQSDLSSTKQELALAELTLVSKQSELSSTRKSLTLTQGELERAEEEIMLYKETFGADVFSDIQPPFIKGGSGVPLDRQINLNNNPTATNPTWRELITFLFADPTDDEYYDKTLFNCTNFAEMLHNNAEAAGIKCAFVTVSFESEEVGHALNAFRTADKGLVYVDCVGMDITHIEPWVYLVELEYDKIAYVMKGREYGLVSIDIATSPEYSVYKQRGKEWSYWLSLDVVESIEIYW